MPGTTHLAATARPEVITALPTAFRDDGALDVDGTVAIIQSVLEGGVDAVFVNGTTAEFPSLDRAERRIIVTAALATATTAKVIVHVGAPDTRAALDLTHDALDAGATRLAALTPYYLPASVAAVERHFAAITAAAPDCELYAYLFPDRSGVFLTPAEAAGVIGRTGMSGAKVSIAGTAFVGDLVPELPHTARVYTGNDGLLPESVAVGARGVVSGVSSAFPLALVGLAHAIGAGEATELARCKEAVDLAVPVVGPSIAALKRVLVARHVIAAGACRMAIDPPAGPYAQRIDDLVIAMRERGYV